MNVNLMHARAKETPESNTIMCMHTHTETHTHKHVTHTSTNLRCQYACVYVCVCVRGGAAFALVGVILIPTAFCH